MKVRKGPRDFVIFSRKFQKMHSHIVRGILDTEEENETVAN